MIGIPWTSARSGSGRDIVKGLVRLLEGSSEFVTRWFCLLQREMQRKHFNESCLKLSLYFCASG